MAKSSKISITNQLTPNNTSTSKDTPQNCIKSIPYILARRLHTIIRIKTKQKIRLKELDTTLNQRGHPTTLINKGFELAEKIPQRELRIQKNRNNKKPLAYVATYNKNDPELFHRYNKKSIRT